MSKTPTRYKCFSMDVVSNYLERGKWIGLKFQKFAILSIVINLLAIYNCLQVVDTTRTSELSKSIRRDWDFGDKNITSSSFPPFSKTNTSFQISNRPNSLVKQRKMHPYSATSYSIINSTKTEPEATINLLFGRERPDSSLEENEIRSDFHRNLEELKKVVKARQKLIKRRSNITENDSGASKLEDNINTINVLIGMLMLANSKLIEQRDKISPNLNSEKIMDSSQTNFKEDKRGNMIKLEESLASSQITSQVEPKTFKNITKSQDQGYNNSSLLLTKLRKFKTNKNMISFKEPPKGGNITQNSKVNDSADHFSVKPGFDSDDATHENATSENNVPSEAQYSGMLFANPASVWNRKDFLRNHKPIVAHDLLYVRPHAQPNPTLPVYSKPLRPENMFVSHIPIIRPPISGIYEHLNPTRQQIDYGPDQRGPIQSSKQTPFEENNVGSRDEEQQQMVPPYNVHNIGWPLTTTDNPHLIQAQFKEFPVSPQRLGEEHQYNTTPKPAIYPPAMQSNPNLGGVGDNEIRSQQPFISPLHQVLMAARNQQAAALELERRRLEHEMEIQKRQQQMKRQHEDNLKAQKLAHDERQKAAQNSDNDQKQQQQNSENQNGGSENQEDNQNQQQHGGNQDQNEDSGQDQNSSGQQGANEGGNSREDDRDMKNFQDFAGDTDFTDLFPPGILSDAEIKEMRKQHQEQKQREQEEREEEQERQRQGSDEEQQGNGEENGTGQEQQQNGSGQQQELGEQTEQNNRTQEEEVQKQPENSFGNRKIPLTVSFNNSNSTYNSSSIGMNNHTIKSQVAEPKYNVTMPKNSPSKLEEELQTSRVKSDSQTTKTPRLYVPNFLNNNNSNMNNGLVGQIERSKLGQQPVATSKRRRSHHSIPSYRGMTSSQAVNDEPSSNEIIILDSEYQDKYMKPYMSVLERRKSNENQEQQKPEHSNSFSGEEEVSSESSFVDFEDQIDSKR